MQLKRHTDKQTKREAAGRGERPTSLLVWVPQREVVTDIFVAWGHQQEKARALGPWRRVSRVSRVSLRAWLGLPAYGGGHRGALRPALPGGRSRGFL